MTYHACALPQWSRAALRHSTRRLDTIVWRHAARARWTGTCSASLSREMFPHIIHIFSSNFLFSTAGVSAKMYIRSSNVWNTRAQPTVSRALYTAVSTEQRHNAPCILTVSSTKLRFYNYTLSKKKWKKRKKLQDKTVHKGVHVLRPFAATPLPYTRSYPSTCGCNKIELKMYLLESSQPLYQLFFFQKTNREHTWTISWTRWFPVFKQFLKIENKDHL